MPPRLTWRNLIPGVIALAILAAVSVSVVLFGGVGKVRGETVRIHILTDQAHGLMQGSEVWLDGQKAGAVADVGFRPASADTLHRVVIAADVREDALTGLRRDSRVSLRSGGTLIGPIVVFMESGTPGGAPLRAGDTLRTLAATSPGSIMEDLGAATRQVPAIMQDVRAIMAHTRSTEGTAGAFLTRGLPAGELQQLRGNIGALRARMSGTGADDRVARLRQRASTAMARADSIRTLLADSGSSLGRFRRDSTLLRNIGEIADDFAALQAQIDSAPGTLSRLKSDSAIIRAIADVRAEMTLLFEDVKRRPLRYLHF